MAYNKLKTLRETFGVSLECWGIKKKKFFKEANEVLKRRRITMADFTRTPVRRQKTRACTKSSSGSMKSSGGSSVSVTFWSWGTRWKRVCVNILQGGGLCSLFSWHVCHAPCHRAWDETRNFSYWAEWRLSIPPPQKALDVKVSWCWTELCCAEMMWFVLLHTQWH